MKSSPALLSFGILCPYLGTIEKYLAQLDRLLKTATVGVEDVIYEERLKKLG